VASKIRPRTGGFDMRFLILPALSLSLACVAAAQSPDSNPLASARVFNFDDMTPKTSANGAVGRSVFSGTLATGEAVAAHETWQPAGMAPNPAHRIQHSELIVVQEGTLEFQGTVHAVRNIGDGPAKYIVIQIGGDTKK
jgi:XRE family transcriptional regulator, regulator of sulfur utilization